MSGLQKTSRYFLEHLLPRHALGPDGIARLNRALRRDDPAEMRALAVELTLLLVERGVFRHLGEGRYLDAERGRRFRLQLLPLAPPDATPADATAGTPAVSEPPAPEPEAAAVPETAHEPELAAATAPEATSAPDGDANDAPFAESASAAAELPVAAGSLGVAESSRRMGDLLTAIRFEGREPELVDGLRRLLAIFGEWYPESVLQLYHFEPLSNGETVEGLRLLEPDVLAPRHPYRRAIESGEGILVDDDEGGGSWYPPRRQLDAGVWALQPLNADGECWGLLEMQLPPEASIGDGRESLRLLGLAMSYHLLNHRKLSSVVYVDWLTKIFNRSFLDMQLPLEIERATRNQEPLAMLVIDLDDFKKVNDTHGHDIGDKVLVEYAAILRRTLRKVDQIFRFGGEEFVVLLPRLPREPAQRAAERLRSAVEKHVLELDDGRAIKVTVSIGGAIFPSAALNEAGLFKAADTACFKAKRGGKNRVEFAEHGAEISS